MVAERDLQGHPVLRGVRRRVVGHHMGVAVRLAAVPEHLHQLEEQRMLDLGPVGAVEQRPVEVEVDRARQQDRVVHRADQQ